MVHSVAQSFKRCLRHLHLWTVHLHTPRQQTAPVVSGLKAAFSTRHVSASVCSTGLRSGLLCPLQDSPVFFS